MTKSYRKEGLMIYLNGTSPFLGVYKAELVGEVLSSPSFAEKLYPYNYLEGWLGKGLITSKGSLWKKHRRLLTPSFHFKILGEFESAISDHVSHLIETMKKNPRDLLDVDLSKWAIDCTINVLLEIVMGVDHVGPKEKQEYIDNVGLRLYKPWNLIDACYDLTPDGKTYKRAVAKSRAFTVKAIERKIQELKEHSERPEGRPSRKIAFLDLLVGLYLDGEQLSIEEMIDEVETFIFAETRLRNTYPMSQGHDTTGRAIAWALFQLGHLPNIQKQLREEFVSILGTNSACVGANEKLKELKYFDRVLKECMRLYPSVPGFCRELRVVLVNILRNFEIRSKAPLEGIEMAEEIVLRPKRALAVDFIRLE
ncbi:cytochrome P450 4V2-like [Galendromus occidentalis]|uniref:Cytochrome P450 4V2-like n=1 Tax=Galendromus occidentalis TaxID=34638 RepID=A0AAJ7WIY4_9ACAR|nr:cytochrome P450 4V2-like [Galendromus occidentalis]